MALMGRMSQIALAMIVGVFAATFVSAAESAGGTQAGKDIRVLYVGRPGSEREKDFVAFLKQHFSVVRTGNLEVFKETDTQDVDVTLLDWNVNDFNAPKPALSGQFSRPVITLGVPGGLMCSGWRLKIGYL